MSRKRESYGVAVIGIFAALVVVLQFVSSFVKIGSFPLTLTLIPIVLGAILYGPRVGAALGTVFGAVVVVCCFAGLDAGGSILIQKSPMLTTAVCMVKGIMAGVLPAIVYKAVGQKKPYIGTVLAAAVAPLGNTGLFLLGMIFLFKDTLITWANGTNTVYCIFTGLVGINFLIELAINMIAAPLLLRVARAVRRL